MYKYLGVDQILDWMIGNRRWAECNPKHGPSPKRRALFAEGQPATSWGIECSDGRVPGPDSMFDQPECTFFDSNVAGNRLTGKIEIDGIQNLATARYALHQLKVQRVVVCGHSNCGLVKAAIKVVRDDQSTGDDVLDQAARLLTPAVEAALEIIGDDSRLAINVERINARQAVHALATNRDLLGARYDSDEIAFVAVHYDVVTGVATWLPPWEE